MKTRGLEMALAKADPVDLDRIGRVDLEGMEAELLVDLDDEWPASPGSAADALPRRHPRRRTLALAASTLAAAAVVIVVLAGGGADRSSRAYGAELVRFAESTPLLLLEAPGWRVQDVYEAGQGVYMPRSSRGAGSMEFVTGPAIHYGSTTISADGTVSGMDPKSVRQRKVELGWHHGKLGFPGPIVRRPVKVPVLDTTALVNTRAETSYITTKAGKKRIDWGGPGDREMAAIWTEDGYTLEVRAWVSNLSAFEERLGWLSRVDSQAWLDAMPAKVVKAADHDAAVREMLKGIPVPNTFRPSRIPDEGLTTNRDQVGGQVTSTVSCLWFRQWSKARRTGDHGAEIEAEKAMATSKHWPILRRMANEGGQPLIWKLAAAMPSGMLDKGPHRWRLLPQAESLGCARLGLPLLPRKQKLQRERGAPLPPR